LTESLPASVAASSNLATQIAQFALDKKAEHILSLMRKNLRALQITLSFVQLIRIFK